MQPIPFESRSVFKYLVQATNNETTPKMLDDRSRNFLALR